MKKQSSGSALMRGFTLIELIVVILILGILGAVAAPRFMDLSSQARAASINGLRGAVLSASALANALQVAQNLASNANITVEGQTVTMVNGYPAATANGIERAVRFDATAFTTSGAYTWTSGSTATCKVDYIAATTTVPATVSAPVTGTNC